LTGKWFAVDQNDKNGMYMCTEHKGS